MSVGDRVYYYSVVTLAILYIVLVNVVLYTGMNKHAHIMSDYSSCPSLGLVVNILAIFSNANFLKIIE